MKTIALSTLALSSFALPAMAGTYLNVEANQGWSGKDYSGALLETHVGFESDLGDSASGYIQGGPAISFPDDADQVGAASGKVGLGVSVTEKLSVYGELSAATAEGLELEGLGVGAKTGIKHNF